MKLHRKHPLLRRLSGYLLPNSCILCGLGTKNQRDICDICQDSLPWNHHACPSCALPLPDTALATQFCGLCLNQPPTFDGIVAPLCYQFPVDRLINRFKHHGQFSHGRVMVDLLETAIIQQTFLPDVIIPVPLHWQRQFRRGFNQADWLAHRLSKGLNIPLERKALKRYQGTPAQQGLTRKERLKNLQHAFRVIKPLRGKRIAVVDDVMTTGSTLRTIATLLKQAGASEVHGWCLARTPDKR